MYLERNHIICQVSRYTLYPLESLLKCPTPYKMDDSIYDIQLHCKHIHVSIKGTPDWKFSLRAWVQMI